MNDINKMPPKCQYCPYWEVCEYPWVCPDIGDNKPDLQPTCNKLATDAISRQLAIDKFAAYIYQAFKDFYRIGLHRKTLTPEQCRRVARNVLAEVPSAQPKSYREGYQAGFKDAQPEQPWISCSERLPEHGGRYLISVLDGINRRTTVAPYLPRCKAWTMTGRMAYWKVIAWMPLPEPYKGDDK